MQLRWNRGRRRPAGPRQPHSRCTLAVLPPHRSAQTVAASAIACRTPTTAGHITARLSQTYSRTAANHPPTILRLAVCRRTDRSCCPHGRLVASHATTLLVPLLGLTDRS